MIAARGDWLENGVYRSGGIDSFLTGGLHDNLAANEREAPKPNEEQVRRALFDFRLDMDYMLFHARPEETRLWRGEMFWRQM